MPAGAPTRKHRAASIVRARYPAPIPAGPKVNNFRVLLERLIPPPIPRAALLELFDNRATFAMIDAWRFGNVKAPQWARDILAKKIAAHYEPLLKLVQSAD